MLFALANEVKPWYSLTGSDAQPKQEGGDISLSIEETKYVHCSAKLHSFMLLIIIFPHNNLLACKKKFIQTFLQ